MDKPQVLRSVNNALLILESFTLDSPEQGVAELSRKLNLGRAAVHRALQTLKSRGFVEQSPRTRKYRLGLRLFEIGSLAVNSRGLGIEARKEMEELADLYRETVNIGVLYNLRVLVVNKHEGEKVLTLDLEIGQCVPLHCTGLGKAILAHLPEAEIESTIERLDLSMHTQNTISDPGRLMEELGTIRGEGVAIDNEEFITGVRCIAAPITNREGRVAAAISISVPTRRFSLEKLQELKEPILHTSRIISARLARSHRL